MKTLTAKDAEYGFGRLIDLARAEPVTVAKHGRPVVVVMAVEEFERLKGVDSTLTAPAATANKTIGKFKPLILAEVHAAGNTTSTMKSGRYFRVSEP
jgi:prevent-host-death family protein